MDTITTSSARRCEGFRFSVKRGGAEIARAYLYVLGNDLHPEPFGLMEDVYVAPGQQGKGIGSFLILELVKKARSLGCYKLIATSRHVRDKVHELYINLGFVNHGLEFRMNL